ncbi:hypothetical protein ACQKNB_23950 [Lysinibacillus xylanilyticus]|uniref:hypothetical protein n=1 Tax=Lysinibacillus xylanilyticus TaxID=582475 RepID=UPI003D0323DE
MKKINIAALSAPVANEVAASVVISPITDQLLETSEQISMSLDQNKPIKELLIIFFDTIELLVPRLVFLGIKIDCTLAYEIRVLLVLPHTHPS